MMPRRLYYDILLVGFSGLFIYMLLNIVLKFFDIQLAIKYVLPLKYFLSFLIVLYEVLNSEKVIKWICLLLIPIAFIGRTFIIMHWPFGFIIFVASTLTIWILLTINTYRVGADLALRTIILLFPIINFVSYRLFYGRHAPIWFMKFLLIAIITGTLAIRRIRSGHRRVDSFK